MRHTVIWRSETWPWTPPSGGKGQDRELSLGAVRVEAGENT